MTWYEDDVERLERERLGYGYRPETLFYGSSSIRLWSSMYADFADYKPANLGFGGSTLAACVWFFDRLILPFRPKQIIFYAGDNDLGDGRHPEEIFIFFQQLAVLLKEHFGDVPFAFISIKPSIARWALHEQIKYTNKLIKKEIEKHVNMQYIDTYSQMLDEKAYPRRELFEPDGLHLNGTGYELWKSAILNYLKNEQLS